MQKHPRSPLVGVFLISLASLALQVLQMRIFAYTLWQHLAFLVVSIAILGFGASGTFLSVASRLRRGGPGDSLAWASALFALTALGGPWLLTLEGRSVDVFGELGLPEFLTLGLYFLVFTLPFFFAGYVISLALTREAGRVDRLYFVNLLGSGLGCFLLLPTLGPLGAEGSLLLVAGIGFLTCLLSAERAMARWAGGLGLCLCLAGVPLAGRLFPFKVAGSKFIRTYTQFGIRPRISRWTPLGKVDFLAGPLLEKHSPQFPAVLFQDGDAPGLMPDFGRPLPESEIHSVSYAVTERPKVLVIGIGGGLDIKWALDKGAREIVGVEINPETLRAFLEDFPEITGDLSKRENLRFAAAEGRNFVRRSEEKFDLIQMSGVDTYTALSSGAYVLSESYLYTEEAFHDYLDHLTGDGLFTFIRFAFSFPRETLRIMAMACKVLADRGAAEPWKHVSLLRHRGEEGTTSLGAVLIKKTPFTRAELDGLRDWASKGSVDRSYLWDEEGENPYQVFARHVREGRTEAFFAAYPYNVKPVQDDRPFFFNQHAFSSVPEWIFGDPPGRKDGGKDLPETLWVALRKDFEFKPVGLLLLFTTLLILAALVSLCIFLPILFHRRKEERGGFLVPISYFLCLGFAYIFLMISAMQRFGLLLGHPTYAISVTMATFLVCSGFGSLASGRFRLEKAPVVLGLVAAGLLMAALLLQLFLPGLIRAFLPRAFGLRVLVTIALLAPMAFLMGFCFPTGIRMVKEREFLIPWAYGANCGASVLGSVLAVLLAMTLGFTMVQWVSAGLYLCAAALMTSMARSGLPSSAPTSPGCARPARTNPDSGGPDSPQRGCSRRRSGSS